MGLFSKKLSSEELYQKAASSYRVGRYEEALPKMEKAAQKGHVKAQYYCGNMYDKGYGTPADKAKALMWFEKAAAQGDRLSQFYCGKMYEKGEGTPVDQARARMWYEKAAAQGHASARTALNILNAPAKPAPAPKPEPQPGDDLTPEERYTKGMELFKAGDYAAAYALLRRVGRLFGAHKDDHPDAQTALGWMYEHGRGVEEPLDHMALSHYKIAAKGSDRQGMDGVVRLTARKETPSVEECQTALDYIAQLETPEAAALRPAMEEKLAEAQKQAAIQAEKKQAAARAEQLYQEGITAYKADDYEKALDLFGKAAEQGNVDAQFCVGAMHDRGEGTAQDKTKALYWYEKAAEQDHANSQHNCGNMYSTAWARRWIRPRHCTGTRKPPNRALPKRSSSAVYCTTAVMA